MDGLRIVTVLEHEFIPVIEPDELSHVIDEINSIDPYLTETEAQALIRLNSSRTGFCQRVSGGIKLAQYCGVVCLKTVVLEVLPKIGMSEARTEEELARSRAALLTMLYHARIGITDIGIAPQHLVRASILDIFIEAFLQLALKQARRGLLSRYVPHSDDLPVVKGRFHAKEHARRNLRRPHLLYCDYDEFTADNSYNRAIKATLDTCRTWIRSSSTQRLWFETSAIFSSISSIRMSASDVAHLPRERMTQRYQPVLNWCKWLLAMASPAMRIGNAEAPSILFDMNRLFESYVSSLEETANQFRVVCRQGPTKILAVQGDSEAFKLKPDITIWHAGPDGARAGIDRIIDAKWKRLNIQDKNFGVHQSDVYQLLAYALRYRCQRLELVFPTPDHNQNLFKDKIIFEIKCSDLAQKSIQVAIRTVPLWKSLHCKIPET